MVQSIFLRRKKIQKKTFAFLWYKAFFAAKKKTFFEFFFAAKKNALYHKKKAKVLQGLFVGFPPSLQGPLLRECQKNSR